MPSPRPSADVRIGTIAMLVPLLQELGHDPARVLTAVGVDLALFADPDNPIRFSKVGRLMAHCARITACPHLGLRLGARVQLGHLGLLGELLANGPTVGAALNSGIRFIVLNDRGGATYLYRPAPGTAALGYTLYQPVRQGLTQVLDTAMAIHHGILRSLCGPGWRASRVSIAHQAPADPAPYRRLFGNPVVFDAPRSEISFPANCLERRPPRAEPGRLAELEQRATAVESAYGETLATRTRRAAQALAVTGTASARAVSGLVGLPAHTLGRRLRIEGTGLRQIINSARAEVARQLITGTRLPLGEIAATLGYSDPSAFSRAFRLWHGQAPRDLRERLATR